MRYLTKVTLAWAFLAWLATTWLGALIGFLFVWAAIIVVGGTAAALGVTGDIGFPDARIILWGLWAALLALALARLVIVARNGDPRRRDRAAALIISLFGLLVVVHLSYEALRTGWPRG